MGRCFGFRSAVAQRATWRVFSGRQAHGGLLAGAASEAGATSWAPQARRAAATSAYQPDSQ
jgi:hypothetical protein